MEPPDSLVGWAWSGWRLPEASPAGERGERPDEDLTALTGSSMTARNPSDDPTIPELRTHQEGPTTYESAARTASPSNLRCGRCAADRRRVRVRRADHVPPADRRGGWCRGPARPRRPESPYLAVQGRVSAAYYDLGVQAVGPGPLRGPPTAAVRGPPVRYAGVPHRGSGSANRAAPGYWLRFRLALCRSVGTPLPLRSGGWRWRRRWSLGSRPGGWVRWTPAASSARAS